MTMEDMPVSVSVLEPLLPDEETAPLITKSQPVAEKKSVWKKGGSLLLYPIKAGYSSGVVCLVFAQLQYAILGYLFKILVDDGMPEFQILFARSLSNTLFSLGMGLLTIHRSRLLLEKGIWFLSAMQGIFGNLGMTTFYISFTLMAEGDAMALTKLSPIFAAVLGWILGWDSLTIQIALGVLVCSGGGVIIEHPPFLFGGDSQGSSHLLGALVALSSALFQALLFMATGRVGSRADTITLMLWYHFAGIFMNIVPLAAKIPDGPVFDVTWKNWVFLLVFCILSFTSVFLNFRGIQLCNATLGTSLQTSAVIFAYMLGYYLLGEKITLFAIAGTVGIFLGIVIIAHGKERLRKAKEVQTKAGDIEA